jgi:hypothetical protein
MSRSPCSPTATGRRERGALRLRAALGSTVRTTSALGPSIAVVDASSGHSGHREPIVHVGLGSDTATPVTTVIGWRTRSGAHHISLSLSPGRHTVVLPPA